MKAKNLALMLLTCLSFGCSSIDKSLNIDKPGRLIHEEKQWLEKEREEKATQQVYASSDELYLYNPEKKAYSRSEAIKEAVKNMLPFLAPVVDFINRYSEHKLGNGRIGFGSHSGLGIYLEVIF